MSLPEPPEYAEFLAPYPEEIRALARAMRRRLLEILPPCIETVWDATQTVVVGFGFGEKTKDAFLSIPAYPKHVSLSFLYGARLMDPEGRLNGAGNQVRHLRVPGLALLEDPYILGLIAQAAATAPHAGEPLEPRTLVRSMTGPKRRPKP